MDEVPIKTVGDVSDDDNLWRYVRLSTLMSILNGSVFVPTLQTLQIADPNEGRACSVTTQEYFQSGPADSRKDLLAHASVTEREFIHLNPDADHWQTYATIWLRELATRRCAWCWYRGNIESMAQWHIYARDGVAIRTNPRRIRQAFNIGDVDLGLIGPVQYSDDPGWEEFLFLRPYFQKQLCYQHENEVRVIFPKEPGIAPGVKFPVDGRKLIDWITLSPLLPADEARELRVALDRIVNSECGPARERDIAVTVSMARLYIPEVASRPYLPDQTGITNFGTTKMPFLLSDDILREYVG